MSKDKKVANTINEAATLAKAMVDAQPHRNESLTASQQRDVNTTPEATEDTVPDYSGSAEMFDLTGYIRNTEPMNNGAYGAAFLNDILFSARDDDGERYEEFGSVVVQWPTENFAAKRELRQQFKKFRQIKDGKSQPIPITITVKKVVSADGRYTNFNVVGVELNTTESVNAMDTTLIGESNIR